MIESLSDFHFLRPLWLLALPALLALLWYRLRPWRQSAWRNVIDAELLPHLIRAPERKGANTPLLLSMIGATLGTLALAGPAWRQLPQPVFDLPSHRVLVMDLSPAMLAADLKPDRLTRAKLAAHQLIDQQTEGETALVAYAGDAFAVVPLTSDTATIHHLLDSLHPDLMPSPGHDISSGLREAITLLTNAGAGRGEILLFSSAAPGADVSAALEQARADGHQIDVIAVGTASGAPVPTAGGGWRRNNDGAIELARTDEAALRQLAARAGGRYARVDQIGEQWLEPRARWSAKGDRVEDEFQADIWQDEGYWLLLPLMALAAFSFRRGYIIGVLILLPLGLPQTAYADWWRNDDQAAHALFQQGEASAAAQRFRSGDWKASALYEAGEYAAAAELWAQQDSARADYNRGNALARAGQLTEALNAYDEALKKDPLLEDAKANRKLIEDLQKQQQQEQDAQDGDATAQDQPSAGQESGNPDSSEQNDADASGDPGTPQQNTQDNGTPNASEQYDPAENPSGDENNQQASEASDEQQTAQNREADEHSANGEPNDMAMTDAQREAEEQAQAVQQWLNRVPNDPGQLLREKFRRMQQRRQQGGGR